MTEKVQKLLQCEHLIRFVSDINIKCYYTSVKCNSKNSTQLYYMSAVMSMIYMIFLYGLSTIPLVTSSFCCEDSRIIEAL